MADIKINTDSLKANRQWVRHKVKQGTTPYRILPPHGEDSNGYPYKKWSLVWGLKDPERGTVRPYVSTLATEKRCPIVEFVDELQKYADERAGALNAEGRSKEDIKKANTSINKLIGDIRPKNIFLYNACDQAGQIGILEVKATAQKKLKPLMMEYINTYSQDPTSLNNAEDDSGVWFNFIRSGEGFKTEYDVAKKQTQQKINGQIVFVDDRSALPEQVVAKYDELAYDIHNLYKVLSYDALKALLLANIGGILLDCKDALPVAEKLGLIPTGGVAVATAPVAAAPVAAVQPGTKKVTLNLADDDDDAPAPAKANTASVEDDAIFKMADDILNG